MSEILRVCNVSKIYGKQEPKVKALNGLTFEVKEQSFTAIIGRSGSGKTTLLNILGGLDTPTEGTVLINGIDIYKLGDKKRTEFRRRKIGYIFQFFNLLPELTVYENICLPSYLDYSYPDKSFFKEVVEKLGVDTILNKYPTELSGGEQQRVAVARALSCKPEIILADEPTGNLDKHNGEELMNLLHYSCRLFKQTIVLVTHDLECARSAERIITLEDGKIISDITGGDYE